MKPKFYQKWITKLDIPEPEEEIERVEIFHQQTKFYPSTNANSNRRISTHLSDQRAILEASKNRKRFFGRDSIPLPDPAKLDMSFQEASAKRRSCRAFSSAPIDLQDLSTLLSALKVTQTAHSVAFPDIEMTLRTYPSGGGLYPVEAYVAWRKPESVEIGVYHYSPHDHALTEIRSDIDETVLEQALADQHRFSSGAGCVVFLTGVFRRSLTKYGIHGYRFVLIEAGEMAQQIGLQSCAMNMSSLFWASSYDDRVNDILDVDGVNESLLLTVMIGEAKRD